MTEFKVTLSEYFFKKINQNMYAKMISPPELQILCFSLNQCRCLHLMHIANLESHLEKYVGQIAAELRGFIVSVKFCEIVFLKSALCGSQNAYPDFLHQTYVNGSGKESRLRL